MGINFLFILSSRLSMFKLKPEKVRKRKKNLLISRRWYKYQFNWARSDTLLKKKRQIAKEMKTFFLEPEPKIALVIRIRGINRLSPKIRSILKLLRLRQLHNAVFIKLNKATIGMLKIIEPYIAYGYPTVTIIKKLVCKRGFLKVNRQRIPLVNNTQVEELIGRSSSIRSIPCIINELFTCGPNFTIVSNSLWPFKLSSPRGGYRGQKRRHFIQGGTFGNHEKYINQFVVRMI